jgi:hypothetical protein
MIGTVNVSNPYALVQEKSWCEAVIIARFVVGFLRLFSLNVHVPCKMT